MTRGDFSHFVHVLALCCLCRVSDGCQGKHVKDGNRGLLLSDNVRLSCALTYGFSGSFLCKWRGGKINACHDSF